MKIKNIILLWLFWALILIGFQIMVTSRLILHKPDTVLGWTLTETAKYSQNDKPYLINPFMNEHVSMDSEFYLSIATAGYDDPLVRTLNVPRSNEKLSLNYAFYPLYPMVMKLIATPLRLFSMNPIAASTLAGIIVSLLGALAGLLALFYIVKNEFDEDTGFRAVFYLLIFPTGFFLAQVYTEGLFIGLSLTSIALIKAKKIIWAGLIAVFAVLTKAVGITLFIPLVLGFIMDTDWKIIKFRPVPWKTILNGFAPLLPVLAFIIWSLSPLGSNYHLVEKYFFGRGAFNFVQAFYNWGGAFLTLFGPGNPPNQVFTGIEVFSILLAIVSSFAVMKRFPGISWMSLAILFISFSSGQAQSMVRYVLTMPSIFIFLARMGKNKVFDRTWTIGSVLTMGMLCTLFSFDMWVA